MGRWQPDAVGRLRRAALELYSEHGYDQTTVAEIAERAGLTERTFFRYFADKREVLFAGSGVLEETLVGALVEAPASTSPLDQVAIALEAADEFFSDRVSSRLRQQVISANTELQERELIKLASLATAFSAALRDRGVGEPTATLSAEAGVAVFKVAFERWIAKSEKRSFRDLVRDTRAELKAAAAN
jgi:AcrR family transcriptional regulator